MTLVGDLGWHDLASVSKLVQHNQRLPVHLDNAADRGGIELHKVVELVLAERSLSANVAGLPQILAKDRHFIVCVVRQERDAVLGDLDHRADLILELAAANHLDVVTNLEALAEALDGHLNALALEVALGDEHGDNVALHIGSFAHDASLLPSIHLDDIAGQVRDERVAVLQAGRQRLEVQVLGAIVGTAGESRHLFQRRVDVRDHELLDLDVLDLEAVFKFLTHVCPGVGRRVALDVARMTLSRLHLAEEPLGRSRAHSRGPLALPVCGYGRERLVAHAVVESRNEADSRLQAVLGDINDLSQVSIVLGRLAQSHPGARLQSRRLGDAQQLGHVFDIHQRQLGVGIDVENTIEGDENISLPLGLDVDEALHDGIWAAALKSRGNGQLVLCAPSLIHSLHDGEDDLSLLAFFASHGPDAGIVHTREEKALGHNGRVAKALAGSSIAVPLAQDLGLLLGIHAGLQLAAAIELAVSSVIVQS
ncbi:hypothetical protein MKX07_004959 [Trichoderma sp. CBMAI-0711]|nr:hypothetical protein MKX07_004959 [Trichoderma sp. CBMAI-0711]